MIKSIRTFSLTTSLVVLYTLSLGAHPSSAQESRPMKMTFQDVLKLYGAPQEKEEQETKRLVIWTYPFGKIVFHDGVYDLSSTEKSSATPSAPQASTQPTEKESPAPSSVRAIDSASTRKIIVANQKDDRLPSQKQVNEIIGLIPDEKPGANQNPGAVNAGGPPQVENLRGPVDE